MLHSRRILSSAAIYGFIVLLPQYLMESRTGSDFPPPITHPEYFYGFLGVALAWQIAFLIMATDPVKYRWLLIPAICEKLSFGLAALALHNARGVPWTILLGGIIDLLLASLFAFALWECTRYARRWGD